MSDPTRDLPQPARIKHGLDVALPDLTGVDRAALDAEVRRLATEVVPLHRAYLVSGSTSDLVALLSARLRDGSLSMERVELAAYLGHEAARQALGGSWLESWPMAGPNYDPDMPTGPARHELRDERADRVDLTSWARGLVRYGVESAVRCAIASGRLAHEHWSRGQPMGGCCDPPLVERYGHRCAPGVLLGAAACWAVCPCDPHCEAWRNTLRAYLTNLTNPLWLPEPPDHEEATTASCNAVGTAARWDMATPEAIRSACLRDVAPWALGLSDPLRDQARAGRS